MRVVILKNFAKEHFPSTPLIDYAVQVEQITTSKVRLLIDIDRSVKDVLIRKADRRFFGNIQSMLVLC